MKKKIGSLLIAFMMVMTMVPSLAFADTAESQDAETGIEINEENFPDSEFRKYLQNWYDQDEDGDDNVLTTEEVSEFTVLYHNSDEDYKIKDLTGIHLLTDLHRIDIAYSNYIKALPEQLPPNLTEIRADDCNLMSIPTLPDSVTKLSVQSGALKELPELPSALEYLWISDNNLTKLPTLPEGLKELSCWGNALGELPELPDGLKYLACSNCSLTKLPELPESLTTLNCWDNQLTRLPQLPEGLSELLCSSNKLTALPKLPAELTTLDAGDNELGGVLDLSYLEYLAKIDLEGNKLTGLKLCPAGSYSEIDVRYNAMSGTDKVTGADIDWAGEDEWDGKFKFYEQKSSCEVNGHSYKTVKTVKATTSKNGYIEQKCSKCNDYKITTLYKVGSVKCNTTKYTYNGKAKKPSVTVKDSKGNTISSKYYTVSYAKGRKAVGKYKVTVKFKTRYSGTKTAYFTIVPKAPSSASATLYGYDDVKFSWKKSTGAKGYSVYYKTETGSYKLLTRTSNTSVKKANLSDGIKYTFKVVPYYKSGSTRYASLKSKTASVYTLKKMATPTIEKYNNSKVRVKWKDIDGQSGYQISKSTSKNKTNIVSTYATTSGQSKVLKATKNKKYYYKVRAYKTVSGKKIYGPWSAVKAYTLSDKVETVTVNITMDNVNEYFEVNELITWRSNVLGETNSLWYEYHICLKDEYVKKLAGYSESVNYDEGISISNDSRILFEYKWDNKRYYPTVDYEKKTYSFVEADIPSSEGEITSRTEECYGWFDKESNHWIVASGGCSYSCIDKDNDYGEDFTVKRRTNIEFTRAQGTLVLTK